MNKKEYLPPRTAVTTMTCDSFILAGSFDTVTKNLDGDNLDYDESGGDPDNAW